MTPEKVTVEGVVIDASRERLTVRASIGGKPRFLRCLLDGRLLVHRIGCRIGDVVVVDVDQHDSSRGRVVARLRPGDPRPTTIS